MNGVAMHMIVGLGNPGSQYNGTRHNFGFAVVDELARRLGVVCAPDAKLKAELASHVQAGSKTWFIKPQTYMNRSGEAVVSVLQFYKIELKNLIVVYDDLDLPLGRIRFAASGSAAGHNGIKSIIAQTGTSEFQRLRLGIGRPANANIPVTDYVLNRFTTDEQPRARSVTEFAATALGTWIKTDLATCMNQYNGTTID